MTSSSYVQAVAVKAVIRDPSGRFLLLRESPSDLDNTKSGQYGVAGGRVRPGEAPVQALHREVHEETGLTVTPIGSLDLTTWYPVIRGVRHQIFGHFVLCSVDTPADVELSDEHDRHVWVLPAEITRYPVMTPDLDVLQALAKQPNTCRPRCRNELLLDMTGIR